MQAKPVRDPHRHLRLRRNWQFKSGSRSRSSRDYSRSTTSLMQQVRRGTAEPLMRDAVKRILLITWQGVSSGKACTGLQLSYDMCICIFFCAMIHIIYYICSRIHIHVGQSNTSIYTFLKKIRVCDMIVCDVQQASVYLVFINMYNILLVLST